MAEGPDPAVLAQAIKGLSDDELETQIAEQGIDHILKQIFEGMQGAFRPDKAGANSAVVQYDIETDEGTRSWTVDIEPGKCTTREGAADSPRLTLVLPIVRFVRLIFGQADGTQLFMSGQLKLKGDMMFAMQFQNFFERRA
ncbi:MAG: SCP2 sterol-binding domain-containing protein [Actinomycetota bacterium]|nr:SCP2 sterol-binding domain-containing protein [Actinomycetota bacterium]